MNNLAAEATENKARRRAPVKQVRLNLVYVDFWSAVKFSFVISLCLAVVGIVFSVLVYVILLQAGVFGRIDSLLSDIVGPEFKMSEIIGVPQILGFSVICGLINTVIGTALGAVGAVIYNFLVRALGGFQLGFTSN